MKIRIKDAMIRNFRFLIEDKFRLKLFERFIEKERTIKNVARKLGCHRDSVRLMKLGKTKFIKWQILKKLIEINKISEEELEHYVIAVKAGKSGRVNEVKFSIEESKELALLVAKGMGDGSIEENFRFNYWNRDKLLIDEFCSNVLSTVGISNVTTNKLKDGRIQAKCNPFVGLIAHINGVPTGNKTIQNFNLPNWIRDGSEEMKTYFVRGLFDDEAHVQFDEENGTRRITIAQGKWIKNIKSLEEFFISIKSILSDLGIESTRIRKQETFIDRMRRKKIILAFSIYRKENLMKFYKLICFTGCKKLVLERILNSFSNKKVR